MTQNGRKLNERGLLISFFFNFGFYWKFIPGHKQQYEWNLETTYRGGGANAGHFSAFSLSFLKKRLFTYINAQNLPLKKRYTLKHHFPNLIFEKNTFFNEFKKIIQMGLFWTTGVIIGHIKFSKNVKINVRNVKKGIKILYIKHFFILYFFHFNHEIQGVQ